MLLVPQVRQTKGAADKECCKHGGYCKHGTAVARLNVIPSSYTFSRSSSSSPSSSTFSSSSAMETDGDGAEAVAGARVREGRDASATSTEVTLLDEIGRKDVGKE